LSHQIEPVASGHYQVLEDHGRRDLQRSRQRTARVQARVKANVRLRLHHLTDALDDDRLIVDEEDGDRRVARHRVTLSTAATIVGPIASSGSTAAAAPSSTAAFGMPKTTLVRSS